MENGAVYLKKGEGRSMKAGGPWVYDNEVERIERYHHEPLTKDPGSPLFAERSLFRA